MKSLIFIIELIHGVTFMSERTIILGAGFSAPASIPIQSKIIDRMADINSDRGYNFLSGELPKESIKFLKSYIITGLYLLKNYGKGNYKNLNKLYEEVCRQAEALNTISSIRNSNRDNFFEVFKTSCAINDDHFDSYYKYLYDIRNNVRESLYKEEISVDLEDVFTSFDKAIKNREYMHDYTYAEMEEVRYSITSLFIYYFTKCINEHNFSEKEYLNFFHRIKRYKKGVTIITTNWDTLVEEYCRRLEIPVDHCFNSPYVSPQKNESNDYSIKLIKLHGSINWLRCQNCGGINKYDESLAASSLFDDDSKEKCMICNKKKKTYSTNMFPEIITPTMTKSFSSQLYINLWNTAGKELRSSNKIVFIGYSLPIADYDFRYLLQRNTKTNAKIDVVLAKNDDPKQYNENISHFLPEKRYRNCFPKNDLNFFYEGFGNYFR